MTWAEHADGSDTKIVGYLRERFADRLPIPVPVAFRGDEWRAWLAEAGIDPTLVLSELLSRQSIDIESLSRLGTELSTPTARLDLFVATMAWGRGSRNARMRSHIVTAIRAAREQPGLLEESARLVRSNDLRGAYATFRPPGIRESFRTKWLFAVGLADSVKLKPLVLDNNVWAALWELGWNSIEHTEPPGRRYRADRWFAYVKAAHRWSHSIPRASPYKVEQALFALGRELAPAERFN